MHRSPLLPEVARRARVNITEAEAVLEALSELSREGRLGSRNPIPERFGELPILPEREADPRDPLAIELLIERARNHPLGLEYLAKGLLASVAATFQVHAFTILLARQRLGA